MTVCTNDVALCNLVENVVPVSVSNTRRNREFLFPKVVELEYDGIGLAAIDARVLLEVRHQEDQPLFKLSFPSPRRGVDVALFVG
jgi:hypothetical protein